MAKKQIGLDIERMKMGSAIMGWDQSIHFQENIGKDVNSDF